MSNDQEPREPLDKAPIKSGRRSNDNDVIDNSGQQPVSDTRARDGADVPDPPAGDADPDRADPFEDTLDVSTGTTHTAAYNRAISDYDPNEMLPQLSEHWTYQDDELSEHGWF